MLQDIWGLRLSIDVKTLFILVTFLRFLTFFYFPTIFTNKKRCTNVHQKPIVTVKLAQID